MTIIFVGLDKVNITLVIYLIHRYFNLVIVIP
jgi:hypothetical protein